MAPTHTDNKASSKADRIVVDNSNLSELKATYDEAVERVSRPPSI